MIKKFFFFIYNTLATWTSPTTKTDSLARSTRRQPKCRRYLVYKNGLPRRRRKVMSSAICASASRSHLHSHHLLPLRS